MSLKAIETRYAGCHFRSRLEARWAVFFDTLGASWEYEPEGFETPDGLYLPDFRVRCPCECGWVWLEIKGSSPTQSDLDRASHLDRLAILIGDIPRTVGDFKLYYKGRSGWCERRMPLFIEFPGHHDRTQRALTAARSARFEHGQSGAT